MSAMSGHVTRAGLAEAIRQLTQDKHLRLGQVERTGAAMH